MATFPSEPYALNRIRERDGAPMPNGLPESLPAPDNPEAPELRSPFPVTLQAIRPLRRKPKPSPPATMFSAGGSWPQKAGTLMVDQVLARLPPTAQAACTAFSMSATE